jgi:protein tyrosine/serine phosphatase
MKFRLLTASLRHLRTVRHFSMRPSAQTGELPLRDQKWAAPLHHAQNLHRVTTAFFRSAQPLKDEVSALHALHIRTVISLRAFHDDGKLLQKSGVNLIRIPIYTWNISEDKVVAALRALRSAEKEGPVLLHCLHGADRTGLISAMYRIFFQNWTREQALNELLHGGYGFHSMWKNIPRYLRSADLEKIRRLLDAAPDMHAASDSTSE